MTRCIVLRQTTGAFSSRTTVCPAPFLRALCAYASRLADAGHAHVALALMNCVAGDEWKNNGDEVCMCAYV